MIIGKFVAVAIMGYLLGSIPFGLLVGRRAANVDIRQYGSGKVGAANVLRIVGGKAATAVLALDLAKGALAVVFAGLIVGESYVLVGELSWGRLVAQVLAALAAVVGHNWSVFLKFKGGGRGVATFFGGLIAMCPPVGLFGGEIFIIGAGLSRYVSLGSIAGAVSTYVVLVPLTIMHGFPVEYLIYTFIGAVAVIVMHRDNIARLVSGRERKLFERAERVDQLSSS